MGRTGYIGYVIILQLFNRKMIVYVNLFLIINLKYLITIYLKTILVYLKKKIS